MFLWEALSITKYVNLPSGHPYGVGEEEAQPVY